MNLKKEIIFGMIWALAERTLAQGISFIVSIILARLLLPEQYGIIAIVLVFINIADVFVNNGFGETLIQKKDADEDDYSTIFCCSIFVSLILVAILFCIAPYIASFFSIPLLAEILPWLSLKLPISAFNTVQHAYVSKHMLFKKFFFATSGGTFISGFIGILMAFNGFEIWALVAQVIFLSTFDTIILLFIIPWRPRIKFSLERAKNLFGFAWKIIISNLLNVIYIELSNLIIGRNFKPAELGSYNRGMQFPSLIVNNINAAIGKVLFPAMAEIQYDLKKLRLIARKSIILSSYIIFPLLVILAVTARPLVIIILTEKWIICVPYIQIACMFYIIQPLQTINWQVIKSLGRADLCLRLELVKKIIGILILISMMNISVIAIAVGFAISGVISAIINMYPNEKLISYSITEQIKDIMPIILCCLLMALGMSFWSERIISSCHLILLQILTGITIYITLSAVFRLQGYTYIVCVLKSKKSFK